MLLGWILYPSLKDSRKQSSHPDMITTHFSAGFFHFGRQLSSSYTEEMPNYEGRHFAFQKNHFICRSS